MTIHEMYSKLLAYSKIDITSQDVTTASYFSWGVAFWYEATSGDLCIGTEDKDYTIVRLQKDGTLYINPKPTPEEKEHIINNFNPQSRGMSSYMLNDRYATQTMADIVDRITSIMNIKENLQVKFGSRSNKLGIWTQGDDITLNKKRRCSSCNGMRKVSGTCVSKTVFSCRESGCEETQRRIVELNKKTSMSKITPAMISHDHINFCEHGLKSTHEAKLISICRNCSGEGKVSVGGKPKFRDWTARNAIILNSDLTYRIEPEKAGA